MRRRCGYGRAAGGQGRACRERRKWRNWRPPPPRTRRYLSPMTAFSFFWHDYETFGRVPRRDRPAQFAGIRTDADLNEIGQSVMRYCQPSPDSLPAPEPCLLTGIVPQTCLEQGLPEHAFAAEIEALLGQPGTIGVG